MNQKSDFISSYAENVIRAEKAGTDLDAYFLSKWCKFVINKRKIST